MLLKCIFRRNIRSMNSISDKKREASREARKKFKKFYNNDNPIDFLRNYGKTNKIEETDEEERKEVKMKMKLKRESEMRLKKSDSDYRPKKSSSKHKKSRDTEEEDKEDAEEKSTERTKRGRERHREQNSKQNNEGELRPKSAECVKRNSNMSNDDVDNYKLKHTGG